jgi:hypothetical protein
MGWLGRLFSRERLEADLDKELRFHFESQIADKVRSGIPESEARRLTRIEFGGIEQIKEDCRERRGTMGLESLLRDVRYALRQLRKAPGFTLTVVLTLALGIGATTAIFTLVQQVMLQSLPVNRPDELWRIGDQPRLLRLVWIQPGRRRRAGRLESLSVGGVQAIPRKHDGIPGSGSAPGG